VPLVSITKCAQTCGSTWYWTSGTSSANVFQTLWNVALAV
jgi:hypothetical protein